MADKKRAQGNDRLWNPMFILAIGLSFCIFTCSQGLGSGTTIYVDYIGESVSLAGAGSAACALFAAITRIVVGKIIDTRGRQLVAVTGMAILTLGTAAPLFNCSGLWVLLWRGLQGIGFSAALTAASTIAADVLPYRFLGVGVGYYGLGQALGNALGPFLAVFLVNTNPSSNLFLGLTLMGLLGFTFACLIRYEKNPRIIPPTSEYRIRWEREYGENVPDPAEEEFAAIEADSPEKRDGESPVEGNQGEAKAAQSSASFTFPPPGEERFQKRIAQNPLLRLLNKFFDLHAFRGAIPMAFLSALFSFGAYFLAFFGTSIGIGNPGLFFILNASVMVVVRLLSGRFMDKLPALTIMVTASVLGIIAFSMLLACTTGALGAATDAVFYAAAIPFGLSSATAMPISLTVSVKCSDPARWGAANGFYYFCYDLAVAVGSFAWGVVTDFFGWSATLLCIIAMAVFAIIFAWWLYPRGTMK